MTTTSKETFKYVVMEVALEVKSFAMSWSRLFCCLLSFFLVCFVFSFLVTLVWFPDLEHGLCSHCMFVPVAIVTTVQTCRRRRQKGTRPLYEYTSTCFIRPLLPVDFTLSNYFLCYMTYSVVKPSGTKIQKIMPFWNIQPDRYMYR